MDSRFYRAFEDCHRGSRELITQRLEVYLPFLAPLKELYPQARTLDIGCGRGEWIELLLREGYAPEGVDLDDGMLEACRALELPARKDDALNALRQLPDESLVVVSGFHIAEHVPFPILQDIVAEAMRVLRPAGLLILETPNAESVVVGTNNFYVDPTHERPIPSLLMSFLTEYNDFARSKILRLQEAPGIQDPDRKLGVMDVLAGTSPDYAVIAQKQAAPEVLDIFDPLFEKHYGVSLDELASRYDQLLEGRLSKIEDQMASDIREMMNRLQIEQTEKLQLIEERFQRERDTLQQNFERERDTQQHDFERERDTQQHDFERERDTLQQSLEQAKEQAERLQAEMNLSLSNAHNWYLRATTYEQQLEALRRSTAWRITAPLRTVGHVLLHPSYIKRSAEQGLRRAAPHARLWLARRPGVERKVLAALQRSPWLMAKLRSLHQAREVGEAADASDPQHGVIDHAPLTPRGRAIEDALRQAMMKGQK
ncbi:methyltransferase domain-containing protein [Pseudomonas capeferrum]|uniref:class I SAM-dependent methyltransferase n=1 Tax=Pseudomonas capeferrum TaxID=1495066 RepID=UPI0015E486FA|nr:class I SAM-dependent methyltransferase [Pseudomonas capeferrum]MBA1204482.1 methyltransferase domain-containing protein [Pseudomonas capeferrum]